MEKDFLKEDVSILFPWDKIYIPNFKIALKYQIVVSIFRFVASFEERYHFLFCEFFQGKFF